jgi:hypothetical protein
MMTLDSWPILAFDPGKTTGVARFDLATGVVRLRTVTSTDMVSFLQASPPVKRVVVEDWKLYPWKAGKLGFMRMWAPEIIGMIQYWCTINDVQMKRVMAVVWQRGVKAHITDKDIKALRLPRHAKDAYLLGVWWIKSDYHYWTIEKETKHA